MRLPITWLAAAASLAVASAQQAGITGPVEAFTFDPPTASLRAVAGYPGAASFGPAILNGLEFASVAPQHNYAVAFQSGNFELVSGLDSGAASAQTVSGVTHLAGAVSWSSDGSFAVLYSASANWLQTVSGLPKNPVAGAWMDLSSLGGPLNAVALDTSGKQIAVAIGGPGSASGLYVMTASQAFSRVLQLANPVALSFSTDATELLGIDAATKQLATVTLATLAFQMTPLDGLADPFAVQESAQKIYIASRSDQLLRELTSTGGEVADLPLGFSPTGIQPFGANSLLVASRIQATDPLWLVTNGTQPAAYFVPAIPQTIGKPRSPSQNPASPRIPVEEHR
jgi:hypothetical protein